MMQGAICAGGECCAFPTQAVQRTCIAVKARAAAELPARFWCAQHAQHNQQPSWTASLNSVHCCPKHSVSPLMLLQTQCYVKHSEFRYISIACRSGVGGAWQSAWRCSRRGATCACASSPSPAASTWRLPCCPSWPPGSATPHILCATPTCHLGVLPYMPQQC